MKVIVTVVVTHAFISLPGKDKAGPKRVDIESMGQRPLATTTGDA